MQKQELDGMDIPQVVGLVEAGITWLLNAVTTSKPLIGYRKEIRSEIDELKKQVAFQGKLILDLQNK